MKVSITDKEMKYIGYEGLASNRLVDGGLFFILVVCIKRKLNSPIVKKFNCNEQGKKYGITVKLSEKDGKKVFDFRKSSRQIKKYKDEYN